jgi:histone H3/H4
MTPVPGKDVGMALLFNKSAYYCTAILLWLLVSLASQMEGASSIMSATAATSPPASIPPAGSAEASQAVPGTQSIEESPQSPLSPKQKRDLIKANFEKMKRDAGELAQLAKALQEELNKSNENILSLDIVEKAEKIEKLAKRIKGTARGF